MKWPRKRHPNDIDTGGREARERAEKALEDVRRRKADQAPLLRWFSVDAEENHYGQNVETIFRGGKP